MRKIQKKLCLSALLCCLVLGLLTGCGKADKAYKKGIELMEDSDYEAAALSLQSAIDINPEKAEYYITYGMILNHLEKYDEALKEFDKAYQDVNNKISKENNKKLYYGKAIAYFNTKNYSDAIFACDSALQVDECDYLDNTIMMTKAAASQLSGDLENALLTYNKIIDEDNKNISAYIERAKIYKNSNDTKNAIADYENALKIDSSYYDAYFELYYIYHEQQNDTKANEYITKVKDMKPKSADEFLQVGRAYYILEDKTNAAKFFEQAARKGSIDAAYYQGMLLMSDSDYTAAADKFKTYIDTCTPVNIPEVYNQIAGCKIELEQYDEAQEYLDKGISLGTTSAEKMLRKNQVILYERTKKYKLAKNAAKEYLASFPDDLDMKKELTFINSRIVTKKLGKKSN